MGNILKLIVTGARWLWKNSWWILPAGEEIFNAVKKKFKRKTKNEPPVAENKNQ